MRVKDFSGRQILSVGVLCCTIFTVALAQSSPVRRAASAPVVWQYGQLIYGPKGMGIIWLSADADSTLSQKLNAAENEANQPGRFTAPLIRVLDVLGAQGWELVSAPQGQSVSYTFKRRVER